MVMVVYHRRCRYSRRRFRCTIYPPRHPLTSKRLSPEERKLAYNLLVADGITSRNDEEFSISHMQALKLAVSNWRLYPLVCGYMIVIGNMSLSNFYPTFVMYLGYNKKDSQ